jgi:hypothetical protein
MAEKHQLRQRILDLEADLLKERKQSAYLLGEWNLTKVSLTMLADKNKTTNARITELESENERMKSVLQQIVLNAPSGDIQPQSHFEWEMWVAGKLAAKVLTPPVEIDGEE